MRVISQDGTMDYPYENSIVFIDTRAKEAAFVRLQAIGDNEASITAKYSTREKAKKAMEKLRVAYMFHNLAKMGETPPNDIGEKLTMGLCGVFEFPTDEELE